MDAYNIAELRDIARRRLPRGVFEFVDRGTEDELSLRENAAVLDRIRFRPRTLVDVSDRSQAIMLSANATRCRSRSRRPAPPG
ncbi:MAG TPA: alpha-hydroxy-acid oxidizing protein [Burkholderiales bacterium]|nr:alpha-hydroxy-acid oxidizing protein [Burkholderiales bacterium]